MNKMMFPFVVVAVLGVSAASAQVSVSQIPGCPGCFPPAGTPMVVTNNVYFPVWTRNADEMTRVQASGNLSLSGLQLSKVLFTVPLGKRLMITNVAANGEKSQGQRTHLSLITTVEGNTTAVPFPLTPRYFTSIGSTVPAVFYADGGTQVTAQVERTEAVGPWNTNVYVSITGYLVNQ